MAATNLLGWVSDLARTHTPRLLAVARGEGLTATDALDATQDAFFTLLGLPQGRSLAASRDDAEALMTVLVRNAARNMRRRHHRARPHQDLAAVEAMAADGPAVDDLIAQAEAGIGLLGCMHQLGEVQRHVVTLRLLEGAATTEVAHQLGLTEGHVAVLLYRARRSLQACLAAHPDFSSTGHDPA